MAYGPDTDKLMRVIASYDSPRKRQERNLYWPSGFELEIMNLNIHSLPDLSSLPELKLIHLGNLPITKLPPLPTNLHSLWCTNTLITDLSPLPRNVTTLCCSGTLILELPPLPSELTYLYCRETAISSLPPLPPTLTYLSCENTQISKLPALPTGLHHLYCSNTRISNLPELPSTLKTLECRNTMISVLPELPPTLTLLNTDGCPLLVTRKEGESIQDYNERSMRLRIQKRTKNFYEDLIASTWHPNRFETWCLDNDEKRENKEMIA